MNKKKRRLRWELPEGISPTKMDEQILYWQSKGKLVPTRDLIKSKDQIEGIRKAGELNTAVLDMVQERIKEGLSTLDIDKLVYKVFFCKGQRGADRCRQGVL